MQYQFYCNLEIADIKIIVPHLLWRGCSGDQGDGGKLQRHSYVVYVLEWGEVLKGQQL